MHEPSQGAPRIHDRVRPLQWTEAGLRVLDQRRLPDQTRYALCASAAEVADAIRTMQVRGAPAIGIAAAYGMVLAARQRWRENPDRWQTAIEADLDLLARARPTAVNLSWALHRMHRRLESLTGGNPEPALLTEARAIHAEDIAANRSMGRLGADLIGTARGLLTHCNTGSLATGGFGTALGVIRTLWQNAHSTDGEALPDVYATETRPWLQGARLTLWELAQDCIPATLICDSAAAYLIRQGRVEWVVVGADRIAANGDVANKIGTYGLAVTARRHHIGFMVVAPTSTIDWDLADGDHIPIEERDSAELLPGHFRTGSCPVSAWNPVFDVTPAGLVSAIVTEKGVVRRPSTGTLRALRG